VGTFILLRGRLSPTRGPPASRPPVAEVFVNISNDGYFGPQRRPGSGNLKIVRMRAVEYTAAGFCGPPTNGITAAIDPAGRVLERLPRPIARPQLQAHYSYISTQTLYTTKWG